MAVNPGCTTSYKVLADFEYFYSAIMPGLNTIRRSHEQVSQQTDGLCVPGPKHVAGGRLRGLDQAIGYGAAGISSWLVAFRYRRHRHVALVAQAQNRAGSVPANPQIDFPGIFPGQLSVHALHDTGRKPDRCRIGWSDYVGYPGHRS